MGFYPIAEVFLMGIFHFFGNFFLFISTILFLVMVHEWGHYWIAKCLGIKVLRFSIGFGKPLLRRVAKDGTEYTLGWLPLGGYVKLLDGREKNLSAQEKSQAFHSQSLWVRSAIVLAGPAANIIFALFMFWGMWFIGVPQIKPIIGKVAPESIAAAANLKSGDLIVAIDEKPVDSWGSAVMRLAYHLGDDQTLTITTMPFPTGAHQTHLLSLMHWRIDPLNPDLFKSLGITPYTPPIPPVIAKVTPKSPADFYGLKTGDKIIKINEQSISDWTQVSQFLRNHPEEWVKLTVIRMDKVLQFQLKTGKQLSGFRWAGYLGVQSFEPHWSPPIKHQKKYPFIKALKHALESIVHLSAFNFMLFGKLILGKISLYALSGPIAIFESAHLALTQGIAVFMGFVGWMSVMLACVNSLPIPGLDGAHFLFFVTEKITRRPISIAMQILLYRLGFIALFLLLAHAMVNDLTRMMS